MRITTILRQAVNDQKTAGMVASVLYTWNADANVKLGTMAMPCAFVQLPKQIRLEVDTVVAREKGDFAIYYLTPQPNIQFEPEQNEALVDTMMALAVDLVGRLRATRKLHIDNVQCATGIIYDGGDRNLTGVKVTFTLTDYQGHCIPNYPTR